MEKIVEARFSPQKKNKKVIVTFFLAILNCKI